MGIFGNINGRWAEPNNPDWYQKAYKKYGRKPPQYAYPEIAEESLKDIQEFGERDMEIERLERLRRQLKEQAKEQAANGGGGKSAPNTAKAARDGGGQENERSTSNRDSKEAVRGGEVIVTGNEFGEYKDIKELRKKAKQYYKEHLQGTTVENPILGEVGLDNHEIEFTRAGLGKMGSTSAKEHKLLLVAHLPDLIRSATRITKNDNVKNKRDASQFSYLHTEAIIDGKPQPVTITIFTDVNGNKYYNHILPTEEHGGNTKDPSVPPAQATQNDSGIPAIDGPSVDSSIPQQKTKRNEKIGSLLIGKTGRKFTATPDRSLDEGNTKDLVTLAENLGGKREGGTFSFKTARDRNAFAEVANAYIGLLDEMNSGKASATEDIERTQKIVRSMRIVSQKSLGKQANMFAALGEAMRCPIVWVDADSSFNGIYHGNVAFLNRNAGMDITKTFWHEQFHWIKANNEALYKELLSYFKGRKRFTKEQIDRFRRDTGRHSLRDDAVIEEILADEFMDVSKRIPMLREMAGEKPTLAQRLVEWVKRMMDRVSELFHKRPSW